MERIFLTYYARKTIALDVSSLDADTQRKFALIEKDEYKMTDEERDERDDVLYNLDRIVEDITGDDIVDEVDIVDFE